MTINMFKSRTDNRVNPSDNGQTVFTVSGAGGGGGSVGGGGGGGGGRPAAPATGGNSSIKSQKISKSVKAIKGFFRRPAGENRMAMIKDIEQTTAEIWLTFVFTVIVGSFFLGGGMYLIWLGSKNNVVDFVVVGGVGTLMGLCFTAVGTFLFCKPLCQACYRRKEERTQEKQMVQQESEYISKAKAKLMTLQMAESLVGRRPSNADLYGLDEEEDSRAKRGKPDSRIQSPSSTGTTYDPPPPVALPTKHKPEHGREEQQPNPVIYLRLRESTEEDLAAISNAAERKNVLKRLPLTESNASPNDEVGESSTDPAVEIVTEIVRLQRGDTDLNGNDHQINQLDPSQNEGLGSSADLLADLEDSHTADFGSEGHRERQEGNSLFVPAPRGNPSIFIDHTAGEGENPTQKKKRVLSAANDRRRSVVSQNDVSDDDAIEVIPH